MQAQHDRHDPDPPGERSVPIGSVIIPAHDEAAGIRRCLDALLTGSAPGELDVVVVCNGCTDATASLARSSGHDVRVIELEVASKPAALRAGDAAASTFPRLYLDADVVLPGSSARQVIGRLSDRAIAARPPISYDSRRSTAPVRSYYRARGRVPSVLSSLWGAGVYGLSAAGRRRFHEFPDVVGDDLWLDRQFHPAEVEIVDCDPVVVTVPRRARELVRVLRRTYRVKAEHRPQSGGDGRARAITRAAVAELGRHAMAGPAAALDAATYAGFAAGARLTLVLAPAASGGAVWERDESSRAS